jgi:hypothetical protein
MMRRAWRAKIHLACRVVGGSRVGVEVSRLLSPRSPRVEAIDDNAVIGAGNGDDDEEEEEEEGGEAEGMRLRSDCAALVFEDGNVAPLPADNLLAQAVCELGKVVLK